MIGTVSVTSAGTLYGLGKISEKVEQLRTQTNGTLSRKDDEIAALGTELDEHRATESRRLAGEHRT